MQFNMKQCEEGDCSYIHKTQHTDNFSKTFTSQQIQLSCYFLSL